MESFTTIAGRVVAEIEEKKSRFIASLAPVQDEAEALAFLQEIREANRMARHNVYAYIVREGDACANDRLRYSDDGEPPKTAGLPSLQVLQHAGLVNVCVVVTRYFGGVLLGTGGLVRAYTQATQQAVSKAQLLSMAQCVDVRVQLPYALYDRACDMAAACGAQQHETDFAAEVQTCFRLRQGDEKALLTGLAGLLHGDENIVVGEPFMAAL